MEDEFVVVMWPEVQNLMDLADFDENASLIVTAPLYDEYGHNAYFVRKSWLKSS